MLVFDEINLFQHPFDHFCEWLMISAIFIFYSNLTDKKDIENKNNLISSQENSNNLFDSNLTNNKIDEDFDIIDYEVEVTDAEQGTIGDGISCEDIVVEPSIGHDDHAHGTGPRNGCRGSFEAETHGDGPDNVFYVLGATFEDDGDIIETLNLWASYLYEPLMDDRKRLINEELSSDKGKEIAATVHKKLREIGGSIAAFEGQFVSQRNRILGLG